MASAASSRSPDIIAPEPDTFQGASLHLASLGPFAPLVARVTEALDGPAWLVGGTVRDALLGRTIEDLDLALPAGSLEAARRLANRLGAAFVPLGSPYGVARVVVREPDPPRRLLIDLADFRGPSLNADLAGRDVTVNALAVPLADLRAGPVPVIDPTGGLADLAARQLRACSASSFRDDPVRVLRLLREAQALGFAVEPATAQLARAAVPRLAGVAAERVRDELTRLLRLPASAAAVREAHAWSALGTVFPETGPMEATAQSLPHRFTVWEHSMRALEAIEALLREPGILAPHDARVATHLAEPLGSGLTRREVLKLAVLFHDVAKPETRREDPDGRVRFIGHDRLGAERVAAIAARLRWPGRASRVLASLVRHHLRPMHLGLLEVVTQRARYRFFRDLGDEALDVVCLTIADAAATDGRPPAAVYRGPARTLLASLLAGQHEAAREAAAAPLLRGDDVMAAFRLAPGPEVGRLLRESREAQALGRVTTREEALAWLHSRCPPRLPASG